MRAHRAIRPNARLNKGVGRFFVVEVGGGADIAQIILLN